MFFSQIIGIGNYGTPEIIEKYYKIQSLNNFHDSFAHETYNKTDEKRNDCNFQEL